MLLKSVHIYTKIDMKTQVKAKKIIHILKAIHLHLFSCAPFPIARGNTIHNNLICFLTFLIIVDFIALFIHCIEPMKLMKLLNIRSTFKSTFKILSA